MFTDILSSTVDGPIFERNSLIPTGKKKENCNSILLFVIFPKIRSNCSGTEQLQSENKYGGIAAKYQII